MSDFGLKTVVVLSATLETAMPSHVKDEPDTERARHDDGLNTQPQ